MLVATLLVIATGDMRARSLAFLVGSVTSVVVALHGARHARPAVRRSWTLLGCGMTIWIVTGVVAAALTAAQGDIVGPWSLFMLVGLLGYGAFGHGVLRMARTEGLARDSAVWLESAVGLVCYLSVWWLVAGGGLVARGPTLGTATAAIYVLGDAVMVSAGCLLLGSRRARDLSSRALVLAIMAALVGDLVVGEWGNGFLTDREASVGLALWLVQYALIATAAQLSNHDAGEVTSRMSGTSLVTLVAEVVLPGMALAVLPVIHPDYHAAPAGRLVVLLSGVVTIALVSWRLLLLVRRMESQTHALARTARTDDLTGLPNRRRGEAIVRACLGEAEETDGGQSFAMAMLDLDFFKSYNDTRGHLAGDRFLRRCATAWRSALGDAGTIYRYGGEEFVVVLPGHDARGAVDALSRLRAVTPGRQSFSAGVAVWRPGDDLDAMLTRADDGLYAAKGAGRARTICA